MNFVVLSSSRGTTFQSVLDAIGNGTLTARCLGLVSDDENNGCVRKAMDADIPVRIVPRLEEDRETYDTKVDAAIRDLGDADAIAALGWMSILSPWFIKQWSGRIINVHPALLPKYGGKGMYGMRVHEAVLSAGEKESGISIHIIDEGVDTGKIIVQKNCTISDGETPESLKKKVQSLEKEWYPKVLQMFETDELQLPYS